MTGKAAAKLTHTLKTNHFDSSCVKAVLQSAQTAKIHLNIDGISTGQSIFQTICKILGVSIRSKDGAKILVAKNESLNSACYMIKTLCSLDILAHKASTYL